MHHKLQGVLDELEYEQQVLEGMANHPEPIVQTSINGARERLGYAINLLKQALKDEGALAQLRHHERKGDGTWTAQ